MQVSMEYATEASLARLPFKIYIMHSMKQRKCYYDEKMVHHGQRAACLGLQSLQVLQILLLLLLQQLRLIRDLILARKYRENKAIVKQKNQSAPKNVNLFLINTRGKSKKGKITSYGFEVV